MEALFVILVFIGILYGIPHLIALAHRDSSVGNTGNVHSPVQPQAPRFRLQVSREQRELESQFINVFLVKIRGAVSAPSANHPAHYCLIATDITDAEEEQPVLCMIEQMSNPQTMEFRCLTSEFKLPYQTSVMENWAEVMQIPVEALLFPLKGQRKIKFTFSVISAQSGKTLASSTSVKVVNNQRDGYIDLQAYREKTEELTLQLAIGVSAADNSLDGCEGEVVQEWIKRRISSYSQQEQQRHKTRLNKTVENAIHQVEEGNGLDIADLCKNLRRTSSSTDLYQALELCLKVAGEDNVAAKGELSLLDDVVSKLDVDRKRYRDMSDKILTHVEVQDGDQLIGIDDGMSTAERKKKLRREYKKWNSRVNHSDPEVRKQAEERLALISNAWRKVTQEEDR